MVFYLPNYIYNVSHSKFSNAMDLIHYLLSPLILFFIPYILDFLPYNLSIANGAGGVGILELLIFQCFV